MLVHVGRTRVAAGAEHRDTVCHCLLVNLIELRYLGIGSGVDGLLSGGEALTDDRAGIVRNGKLFAFEHAREALYALSFGGIGRN